MRRFRLSITSGLALIGLASMAVAQTTSSFSVCTSLLDKVNPPDKAFSKGGGDLTHIVQSNFWEATDEEHTGKKLDAALAAQVHCPGTSNQHGPHKLLTGGSLTAVPPVNRVAEQAASYIGAEPVYVEISFPAAHDLDLIVRGWVDAASNFKICEWAAHSINGNERELNDQVKALNIHCSL